MDEREDYADDDSPAPYSIPPAAAIPLIVLLLVACCGGTVFFWLASFVGIF